MSVGNQNTRVLTLAFAIAAASAATAIGQTAVVVPAPSLPSTQALPSLQPLLDFKPSQIKFNVATLMEILRDSKHEGWVLAPYPDPKTNRPLIGAGFSLDVPASEHLQRDLFNPRSFIEPSSAQLWQAAGLEPERLQKLLDQFARDLENFQKKSYRKRIRNHKLPPVVTDEEATRLLRISAIQAIYNAGAYCRNFDRLTASQQMALSQLVFQMGVNLEEFVQFLSALNNDDRDIEQVVLPSGTLQTDREHWEFVQQTLIDSQWAKRYTTRAVTVIAMFNPHYAENPAEAEAWVQAILIPPSLRTPARPRRRRR